MSRQIQIRRGTATEHSTFTGALGEVTMDTTNKTLRVHDGQTAGGVALAKQSEIPAPYTMPENYDFVVESQLPTAENNYTWYRKYKSGWVEQGGYVSSGSQTSVTFPFEMANTNYFASFMFAADNLQVSYTGTQGISRSTTGMKVCGYYNNGSNRSTIGEPMYWKIEGMSAA